MSSYSSHTTDNSRFINYAENLLIPDMIAEGRTETAEDLERLIKIYRKNIEQILELKRQIEKRDKSIQSAIETIAEMNGETELVQFMRNK